MTAHTQTPITVSVTIAERRSVVRLKRKNGDFVYTDSNGLVKVHIEPGFQKGPPPTSITTKTR